MNSTHVPVPLKRIAHAGSVTFGRITARSRVLPDFLVCGGQRCGTTSLYRALAGHPAIVKAVLHKGVHYFDTSYHRGIDWYRSHFPLKSTVDRIRARVGVAPLAFESSPYYMYHPQAAERIAQDLPGVRLIALVRDPVERAYSQHAHEVARGFEPERDFRRALALEPSRVDGEVARMTDESGYYSFAHQHHAYRGRGEYVTYLARLAGLVGPDRLLVLDSAELFTAPESVYDQVLDFLGLPRISYPIFEQHNARPRPAPMDEAVRAELRDHFQPFDERLRQWLGRDLSWLTP